MSKRILFVDDEPMVLQGIQRSLRIMRTEWDMEFATGGPEALEIMARGHFDVVISDMRMPGMSGAQLLEQVKAKFPRTVRMILSGQSDRETILRSIGPTHQYLSKPCSVEELRRKLGRAFALRDLLDNPTLKDIVSRMQTVPSLPSLYVEITEALQSPGTSVAELGSIIERDMGMASKVLQLVNSAFFGLPCQVASPKQAVALIGIDNIRALVLSVHVFSELEHQLTNDLAFLWKHGCATAAFARVVSQSQESSRNQADDAFTAGLLHDIGRLVLASACTAEYSRVLRTASDTKTTILACEREVFGCTHAEVGAYLLGLWGLPDAIVEAVAWHHEPSQAHQAGFSPLIAVHAADHCDHLMHSYPNQNHVPNLDENLLAEMGLKDRLTVWLQACQELDRKGEDHA
jgi:HD-like signal output (HDOD) protein/ActR/RegA family two-component response regulator